MKTTKTETTDVEPVKWIKVVDIGTGTVAEIPETHVDSWTKDQPSMDGKSVIKASWKLVEG